VFAFRFTSCILKIELSNRRAGEKTTRPYRLGRREESLKRTREKILRAADGMLGKHGVASLTMEAVARAAGVSRVSIYDHFGDRSGLIEALTWRMFQQHDVDRVRRARLQEDVRRSLVDFVRENTRYQYSFGPSAMSLLRVAMDDPDAAKVVSLIYVEARRASIRELIDRLEEAGELAEGWSVERAIDVLMVITSLESLDGLIRHAALDSDAAADVLARLAEALLGPDDG
jgi:AcrR family transcriptional regulator